MGEQAFPAITYLLPIKLHGPPPRELGSYLRALSRLCPVVVVDNSDADSFRAAHSAWSAFALHLAPDPAWESANPKVANVLTGLTHVHTDLVVVADDDVRYGEPELAELVAELETADLVIPQNYFDPIPWYAAWDTARILLNRVTGGDFPGTLGIRTELIRGGYDGDVLFENLELIRTVVARGGELRRADGLYVRRLPPTFGHFRSQRIRNAYDEFARPRRLAVWLLMLPAAIVAGRRRPGVLLAAAASLVAAAEVGRRRHGGTAHFPAAASLFAPLWAAERAICVWLALAVRLRGGVLYNGSRIRKAANAPDRGGCGWGRRNRRGPGLARAGVHQRRAPGRHDEFAALVEAAVLELDDALAGS